MTRQIILRTAIGVSLGGILMCILLIFLAAGVGDYIVAVVNMLTFITSIFMLKNCLK